MSHPIGEPASTSASVHPQEHENASSQHFAGAFDIRNVIGALIGIYGIVLIICSFAMDPGVNPDTGELKSSADNLWSGVGMFAVAVIFILWAKFKPIVVKEVDNAD